MMVATAFQYIEKSHHVGLYVRMRILDGIPHARLSRKVADMREVLFGKEFFQYFAVGKVD